MPVVRPVLFGAEPAKCGDAAAGLGGVTPRTAPPAPSPGGADISFGAPPVRLEAETPHKGAPAAARRVRCHVFPQRPPGLDPRRKGPPSGSGCLTAFSPPKGQHGLPRPPGARLAEVLPRSALP